MAASILSDAQQKDLLAAVQGFLRQRGHADMADDLVQREGLAVNSASTSSTNENVLERKWTSILRLQRKVLDLEKQLSATKISGATADRPGRAKKMLPVAPHVAELNGHRSAVQAVCSHPRFNLCITVSEDASGKVWDVDSGEVEATIKGHTGAVTCLAISSDGHTLATGSSDMTVRLWDVDQDWAAKRTLRGHEHSVSGLAFLPGGVLCSVSRDGSMRLWSVADGMCQRSVAVEGAPWLRCVAANENSVLVGAGDHAVRAFTTDGSPMCTLLGHTHVVESVAVATGAVATASGLADSVLAASAARDKSIRVWNVSSKACIHTLNGHLNWVRGLVFGVTLPVLYSCSDDKAVKAWDLTTGRCTRSIDSAHDHFVTSIALASSGGGAKLVTGCVDGAARIWQCR